MKPWTQAADILTPAWVGQRQSEFQSRQYANESSRMEFVLDAAAKNFELTGAAPLAEVRGITIKAAISREHGKSVLLSAK